MLRSAMRQLKLAFRFAEARLDTAGLKAARRDVDRFLRFAEEAGPGATTGGMWFGSRVPAAPPANEIAELQMFVRRQLDAMIHHVALDYPEAPQLSFVLGLPEDGGRVVVSVISASVRDRFLMSLMLLLARVGSKRVLSCRNCKMAFLKNGRRTHCARVECRRQRQAAYFKAYTKTPSGRLALQRQREKLYAKHGWKLGGRKKKSTERRASRRSS
jgi:hypothetical protein